MKFTQILKAYGDLWFHLIRIAIQLTYGIWQIGRLPLPLVSIFGSSKLPGDDPHSSFARELSMRLVRADVSVITGGGPGIMEAANCGARRKGERIRSIGIGVKGLDGGILNQCVDKYIIMDFYFPRKWLLTRYSMAFVIFPGGVGTLEELAELLTLMQTDKRDRAPIVLVGRDYWNHILRWMRYSAFPKNLIFKSDLDALTVTDDINEAFNIVKAHCDKCI